MLYYRLKLGAEQARKREEREEQMAELQESKRRSLTVQRRSSVMPFTTVSNNRKASYSKPRRGTLFSSFSINKSSSTPKRNPKKSIFVKKSTIKPIEENNLTES